MPLLLRSARICFLQCRKFSSQVLEGTTQQYEEKLKMRGFQIHGYGGPDELQFSDKIRIPPIQDTSSVLVKVKAAGVNPIDVLMCKGYGSKMLNAMRCDTGGIEFPITLGREFSGVVASKGMGVDSSLQLGDEVWGVVQPHHNGSHAEYVVVPSFCLARKPKILSHVDAAGVLYAGLTAWSGLYFSALFGGITGAICPSSSSRHGQGGKVLVLGGSGGVGTMAIQMLKAEGATVFATCSSDAGAMVKNLGADSVFDYSNPEDMAQMERFGPYDIILDCAGQGSDYAHRINTTFKNYVTFSSPLMRNTDEEGIAFGMAKNILNLIENNTKSLVTKKGLIKWGFFAPAPQGIEYLGKLVDNSKLLPVIDTVYPLMQLKDAFDKVASGHLRGKVIVDFEKESKDCD